MNTDSFFCSHVITGPRKNATANVTTPIFPPMIHPSSKKMISHDILMNLKGIFSALSDTINAIASYGEVPSPAVMYIAAPSMNTMSAGISMIILVVVF